LISVEDVDCAVRNQLKLRKAAGYDNITAEHIIFAHPRLLLLLCDLFNLMLAHGYVPVSFGKGLLVPLLKDRNALLNLITNYRGITLSPVVSKLFELCIDNKFSDFLGSSHLQFGFKKCSGCPAAVFTMHQVIQFYLKRGSNVFVAALDASKAFDCVTHTKLFDKLVVRGVPLCFLNVVRNWYEKLVSIVRWNGVFSYEFCVMCGVRQGGFFRLFCLTFMLMS